MKPKPDKVHSIIAKAAIMQAKIRNELFTQYILIHYRASGKLAPGCDFRDLIAWYEDNMPKELAKITKSK